MITVAVAAIILVVAGCITPYAVNSKKKSYEAEDQNVLNRMYFLDGFTRGWDAARNNPEITYPQDHPTFIHKK